MELPSSLQDVLHPLCHMGQTQPGRLTYVHQSFYKVLERLKFISKQKDSKCSNLCPKFNQPALYFGDHYYKNNESYTAKMGCEEVIM